MYVWYVLCYVSLGNQLMWIKAQVLFHYSLLDICIRRYRRTYTHPGSHAQMCNISLAMDEERHSRTNTVLISSIANESLPDTFYSLRSIQNTLMGSLSTRTVDWTGHLQNEEEWWNTSTITFTLQATKSIQTFKSRLKRLTENMTMERGATTEETTTYSPERPLKGPSLAVTHWASKGP